MLTVFQFIFINIQGTLYIEVVYIKFNMRSLPHHASSPSPIIETTIYIYKLL